MSVAYVQSVQASNSNINSGFTLSTAAFTPTTNNVLVVACGYTDVQFGGLNVPLTPFVTDSQGNTYGLINFKQNGNSHLFMFVGMASASTSNVVTVNWGTNCASDLVVAEYSGLGTGLVAGGATSSSGFASTSITVPTQTGVIAGDLLPLAVYSESTSTTMTISADFTLRQQTANAHGQALMFADFIPSSGGSVGGETVSFSSSAGTSLIVADVQVSSVVRMRDSQMAIEKIVTANPNGRLSQMAIEKLVYPNPHAHMSQIAIEMIVSHFEPQESFLQFLLVG